MTRQLFPYQHELIEAADAARAAGHRHILNCAPTGSGKTDVMCAKIRRDIDAGHPCLVLADQIEIVDQIVDRLALYGMVAGYIMGGRPLTPWMRVQVATRQSLSERFLDRKADELPDFARLHVDEAHTAAAPTFRRIFDRYPDALRDGYTATPGRKGGLGLGAIFDTIVMGPSVKELQAMGRLVPTVAYSPLLTSLEGLRTRQGDFVEADLDDRLNRPKIVGDVVTHWLRLAHDRLTLVYAVTISHAIAIRDAFREAGIAAEYVCGKTLPDERAETLAALARGELQVVVNVGVLTKGFDCPPVNCIQVARPTKSLVLWLQIVGRGLRAHPGKTDCLIVDHGGMVNRLGMPEDEIQWTLDPDRCAVNVTHQFRKTDSEGRRFVECAGCGVQRKAGEACDACGYYPPPAPPRHVSIVDGELVRVERGKPGSAHEWTHAEKMQWYGGMFAIARERGTKKALGFARAKHKEKFGHWPPWGAHPPPVVPTPEMRSWEKSRRIAYAKSQGWI